MATIKIYDKEKNEVGNLDLAPEVFEVEVRPEILNMVVRYQQAAKRAGTHKAKGRSDKRGGGRKPWRQKGTGRARAGTIRSPLWRGGGVVFGPQPRSYGFKVNKKVRKLALRMALSSRLAEDNLIVVNNLDFPEAKTKDFAQAAQKLGLEKALIVFTEPDNNLVLSARNIPWVKTVTADKINVYDILRYPQLVLVEGAAQDVQERLR